MQTNLSEAAKKLPRAEEAESILRSCVHCGFCNATCPTYQLLGDESSGATGSSFYTGIGDEDDVTQVTSVGGWAYEWRAKERPLYVDDPGQPTSIRRSEFTTINNQELQRGQHQQAVPEHFKLNFSGRWCGSPRPTSST